jgi:hypothetical protein
MSSGEAPVSLSGLTMLVPQPRHKPLNEYRFPWSEDCDRIFRNKGVTGSSPVSSTKRLPGYPVRNWL